MSTTKGKKLRDVIDYLDGLAYVKVVQTDVYLITSDKADEEEEIYVGDVMSIPWYIVDFYLANDANSEAISIDVDNAGNPYFEIYVVEDLERLR